MPAVDAAVDTPIPAARTSSLAFIQALRGIAALAVVLWHASRNLGPYGTGLGGRLFGPGGTMGVDLFFLISGFIMFHTTHRDHGTWREVAEFFVKRAARIWPVWVVALAVAASVKWPFGLPADPTQREWLLGSLLFVPTAAAQSAGAPTYAFPVLGVGWTLNYEMYFYLFFGFSLGFGRWRWHVFGAWLLFTLFAIPLLSGRLDTSADLMAWLSFDPARDHHYTVRYLDLVTNPLILMFAAGVGIAALYHFMPMPAGARRLRWLALAAATGVALQYVFDWRVGHGIWETGITLVPLMLVLCLADRQREFRVPRPLILLGNVSYSLYLFHPIVQEQTERLAAVCGHRLSGIVDIIATTFVSIAVATFSWWLLERGLCEWIKRAALRRMARAGRQDGTIAAAPS